MSERAVLALLYGQATSRLDTWDWVAHVKPLNQSDQATEVLNLDRRISNPRSMSGPTTIGPRFVLLEPWTMRQDKNPPPRASGNSIQEADGGETLSSAPA